MNSHDTIAHRPSRLAFGVWLGLLAVGLHAFSPLLAPILTRAASSAVPQAHDHSVPGHHHGAPDATAKNGPPAPDLVCVGDCPCCSLGDRVLCLPTRPPVVLASAAASVSELTARQPTPHVHHPGASFPPRAPPSSA